jgi:hypothetical protein
MMEGKQEAAALWHPTWCPLVLSSCTSTYIHVVERSDV